MFHFKQRRNSGLQNRPRGWLMSAPQTRNLPRTTIVFSVSYDIFKMWMRILNPQFLVRSPRASRAVEFQLLSASAVPLCILSHMWHYTKSGWNMNIFPSCPLKQINKQTKIELFLLTHFLPNWQVTLLECGF